MRHPGTKIQRHWQLIPLFLLLTSLQSALSQPWQQPLMMALSSSGTLFGPSILFQDSCSVPSAIRWHGDTLVAAMQSGLGGPGSATWDKVVIKFSYDDGMTWTQPQLARFVNLPVGLQRPFDPTLIRLLNDSLRMYFSSSLGQVVGDSSINTYSAFSSDGISYRFETGARVDNPTNRVIDPAVAVFNNNFHYIAPIGAPQQGAYHYVSMNGIMFNRLTDIPSDNLHNWTGNLLVNGTTELRFYGTGGYSIWYNTSQNGNIWTGYTATNVIGADPTVVKRLDNTYLMIYCGQPYSTAVEPEPKVIHDFAVSSFPNPFNSTTSIQFHLEQRSNVTLSIRNIAGSLIQETKFSALPAGSHRTSFHASKLPSGVYLCTIETEHQRSTQKLLLIR